MFDLDHVIFAVNDFDAAGEDLYARYGLASVEGGRHVGLGTGNRIVPLTGAYLELMAIVDEEEARAGPLGQWLLRMLEQGEGPAALCLRTENIDAVAERLGTTPLAMSRANADGTSLSWRLAGLSEALAEGLPFFIEWDGASDSYPGRLPAQHAVAAHGIEWVELSGDTHRINEWLGDHNLDLRLVEGEPRVARIGVRTDAAEVVIEP